MRCEEADQPFQFRQAVNRPAFLARNWHGLARVFTLCPAERRMFWSTDGRSYQTQVVDLTKV